MINEHVRTAAGAGAGAGGAGISNIVKPRYHGNTASLGSKT